LTRRALAFPCLRKPAVAGEKLCFEQPSAFSRQAIISRQVQRYRLVAQAKSKLDVFGDIQESLGPGFRRDDDASCLMVKLIAQPGQGGRKPA
jgi:hypothetical protein